MRYRILGPVEADDGDRIVVAGSGKPVSLLAYLLLHANEVVSTDRLLDAIWGEHPPRTAAKSLQTYISALRRSLGDGVIATRPRGYLLTVEQGSLDAHRFSELVEQGTEALRGGDPTAAAAALRAALALWRGPALGDISYEDWARSDADRLEEARLQAVQGRLEADLALGRHAEVLPELESLAREHPLREHFLGLLMLAMYRCGRQVDALERYRNGRRRLLDEFGIEPAPELSLLEQRILQHDPALAGPIVRRVSLRRAAHTRRRLAVAVLVGAVATAALLASLSGPSRKNGAAAANSVVRLGPDGQLDAALGVGATPAHVARGVGFVWTSNENDDTVSRIAPAARTVETIPVGRSPEGLVVAGPDVWVADGGAGTVDEIDPRAGKVVRTIRVGNGPLGVAARGHDVWVANSVDGTLMTIDARSGKVLRTVLVGPQPTAVVATADAVWVALAGSGALIELDRDARSVVASVNVGADPTALAVAGNRIWVANRQDGTVMRVDAESGSVDATVPLGAAPTALAVSAGTVWVALDDGRVARIDAGSARLLGTSFVGGRPAAVVADGPDVWVTALDALAAHRGGTLRVEADGLSACRCVDPIVANEPQEAQLLDLVYDGLVAYRRVGGPAGSSLVGDLARSVPQPTNDGRTYVFHLRRGVRFSNGEVVRATDVRASFGRLFRVNHINLAPFYTHILGVDSCGPGGRCDLSRGVVADDRTGTVTLNLNSPDPELLYALALPFAFVFPGDAPMAVASHPLPGTGPYEIKEFVAGQRLVLSRNPDFRVFSPDATPDGFPNRIVATLGRSATRQVVSVENGSSDFVNPPQLPLDAVGVLATQFASQLHVDSPGTVEYAFLNTRVPPFNSLDARRAVNDAVDRALLVRQLGGPVAARPTCQILPPGFPGYRPYCPYGQHPSAAGVWNGPDLTEALKLVRASGTRGERVHVWAPGDHASIATYFAALLRRLGYRSTVHVVSLGRYYTAVGDPKTRAQIGWGAWVRDYTSAADFIKPLFSCSGIATQPAATINDSFFCDSVLEHQIAAATTIGQQDPPAADAAWAAADKTIVDSAAAVPYANYLALTLLSRRTVNYEFNPQWGALLDQLWVR